MSEDMMDTNPDSRAALAANARSLEREIAWFGKVMETRFHAYFMHEGGPHDIHAHAPPDIADDPSLFAAGDSPRRGQAKGPADAFRRASLLSHWRGSMV